MKGFMRNRRYHWALLTLAVCAGTAGAQEDRALQAFERLGATITRDGTRPGKPVVAVRFDTLAVEPDEDLGEMHRGVLWPWGTSDTAAKVTNAELSSPLKNLLFYGTRV